MWEWALLLIGLSIGGIAGWAVPVLLARRRGRDHEASGPLAHRLKLLQQLTDALPAFIAYIDHDYHYRFVNRAYCRFFGKPRSGIVGRPMVDTVGEDIFTIVRPRIDLTLAGEPQHFETQPESLSNRNYSVQYIPDRAADGTIQGVFALTKEITDFKTREKHLEDRANRDPLTKLLNRRGMETRVDGLPADTELSLILVDLDHFKQVNDNHGHAAGDEVLVKVAQCLIALCRPQDIAGRYGGDEFLLVLQAGQDVARRVADRTQQAIRRLSTSDPRCRELDSSIGIIAARPDTFRRDIERVDQLLYQSKTKGRGRISAA